MNLKVLLVSILVVSLNLSSCSFASSKLPANPKSISINWHKNGGMLWFSESISINNDSCIYKVNREGIKQNVKFHLSSEKLNALYQIFISNQFDLIKTNEEDVHDRGGTSISLRVDQQSFEVSNSGMSYVKDKYIRHYHAVEFSIHKYANEELDKQKKSIVLKLDESISNSSYNVVLYDNDQKIYTEKEDGVYQPITKLYFEMNNKFEVYFMTQDGNHDYDKMVESFSVVLDNIPVNTTELNLSLVEGELIIK